MGIWTVDLRDLQPPILETRRGRCRIWGDAAGAPPVDRHAAIDGDIHRCKSVILIFLPDNSHNKDLARFSRPACSREVINFVPTTSLRSEGFSVGQAEVPSYRW
ncbi:MAG: hypothetical protein M1827_006707 [Pycnora praestabilis]|nr:MAG: hypothetical protein M1827_006707 [Pycnora praestabilis]